MTLDLLLKAAKYVEYAERAKERGEEPDDFETWAYHRGLDPNTWCSAEGTASYLLQRQFLSPEGSNLHQRQSTSTSGSSSTAGSSSCSVSCEDGSSPMDVCLSRPGSFQKGRFKSAKDTRKPGNKKNHNVMEKHRREQMRTSMETLRSMLPVSSLERLSSLALLKKTEAYIHELETLSSRLEGELARLKQRNQDLRRIHQERCGKTNGEPANGKPANVKDLSDGESTSTASESCDMQDFENESMDQTNDANTGESERMDDPVANGSRLTGSEISNGEKHGCQPQQNVSKQHSWFITPEANGAKSPLRQLPAVPQGDKKAAHPKQNISMQQSILFTKLNEASGSKCNNLHNMKPSIAQANEHKLLNASKHQPIWFPKPTESGATKCKTVNIDLVPAVKTDCISYQVPNTMEQKPMWFTKPTEVSGVKCKNLYGDVPSVSQVTGNRINQLLNNNEHWLAKSSEASDNKKKYSTSDLSSTSQGTEHKPHIISEQQPTWFKKLAEAGGVKSKSWFPEQSPASQETKFLAGLAKLKSEVLPVRNPQVKSSEVHENQGTGINKPLSQEKDALEKQQTTFPWASTNSRSPNPNHHPSNANKTTLNSRVEQYPINRLTNTVEKMLVSENKFEENTTGQNKPVVSQEFKTVLTNANVFSNAPHIVFKSSPSKTVQLHHPPIDVRTSIQTSGTKLLKSVPAAPEMQVAFSSPTAATNIVSGSNQGHAQSSDGKSFVLISKVTENIPAVPIYVVSSTAAGTHIQVPNPPANEAGLPANVFPVNTIVGSASRHVIQPFPKVVALLPISKLNQKK